MIKVEFSGGLETLFENQKTLSVDAPEGSTILWLLGHLESLIVGDKTLFLQDENVRPGILVLVNDTDWELLGEEEYRLENGDVVHFASTLHGG